MKLKMIKVDIFYNQEGLIEEYQVVGHADSVEEGFDQVCAMVSLTTQLPVLGLEQHLKRKLTYALNEEKGTLSVKLKDKPDELSEAILQTMVCGLANLQREYGKYLSTEEHRR